jgi:hypothetical protein
MTAGTMTQPMSSRATSVSIPPWLWFTLAGAAFLFFVSAASSWQHARNADRRAALLADLHAGSLSTPAAFEARCGHASAQHTTTAGTVLEYSNAQLLVTLPAQGAPSFQMLKVFREGRKYRNVAINVDEDFAIGRLHCVYSCDRSLSPMW